MKVKLVKRSRDTRVIVELEDEVQGGETASRALRRLERSANRFLHDRVKRKAAKRA